MLSAPMSSSQVRDTLSMSSSVRDKLSPSTCDKDSRLEDRVCWLHYLRLVRNICRSVIRRSAAVAIVLSLIVHRLSCGCSSRISKAIRQTPVSSQRSGNIDPVDKEKWTSLSAASRSAIFNGCESRSGLSSILLCAAVCLEQHLIASL